MRNVLLLSLVTACAPGTDVSDADVQTVDLAPPTLGPVVGDDPATTPSNAWPSYRSYQATVEGTMITAGQLDGHETTGYLSAQYSLGFTFDVFTPTGWAMVGGEVDLSEPLEAGQHLEISIEDLIGCSGPEPGIFDFDDPAESVADVVVMQGEMRDQLVLFITADFGAGGQVAVTATAGATD